MAYIYRGAKPYIPGEDSEPNVAYQPQPHIGRLPDEFNPSLCGSMQGYRQHIKHKQKQCRRCLDEQNLYQNERKARKRAERAICVPA